MKYNKSEIMKNAWTMFRMNKNVPASLRRTFSDCLKVAWAKEKRESKESAEAEAKGAIRMSYADYKRGYANCETERDSYDKRTKTIVVYTKRIKGFGRYSINGVCSRCHTYCNGDCVAC